MNRKILFTIIALLPITLFAQDFLWSLRGGCNNTMGTSAKWNRVLDITSDLEGNTYLLAQSGSSLMHLDDVPLVGYAEVNNQTNNNQFNLVLASYTPEGENRWTKVIGGRLDTYGYSLQTDNLGHVYLSGRVFPLQLSPDNEPIHFDTDTILPQGVEMNEHKKIMYLAQYDTEGVFNWLRMPEPDTVSQAGALAFNSFPYKSDVNPLNGDVYWHCMLREGAFDWEGDNIINEEGDYILHYNSEGEVIGTVKLDMSSGGPNTYGNNNLLYMERDHDTGIFYIAGTQIETYYPLIIGGTTITDRLYAAAFSPTGELLWLIEGNNDESINGLFANNTIYDMKIEDGYLYFTGTLASGAEFNGHVFDLDEATACSPFIMKLDLEGNTVWAQISATEYNSYSKTLAIRGNEVAIAGQSGPISWPGANSSLALTTWTSNSQISRFDKISGNLIGLDSLIGNNWPTDIQALHAPGDCNYYIGGNFRFQIPLGQDILEHTGASERSYFYTRYSYGTDLLFTYSAQATPGTYEFNAESTGETITWDFGDGSATQTGTNISHTFAEEGEYQVCATASGDCESQYCLTITYLSTGIAELAYGLRVYPNPAFGEIRVDGLDHASDYSLVSLSGKVVQQGKVSSNSSIDISGISKGMYVLILKTREGQLARMKVVVE